jgi:hypothetical protein
LNFSNGKGLLYSKKVSACQKATRVKKNGRLAPAKASQAEPRWGSIRRGCLPARLGAHWEIWLQVPVRKLYSHLSFYCHVDMCVARWQSARDMIEWLCTQERRNPEVVIIFGATARYCQATAGSSNDDAHPAI